MRVSVTARHMEMTDGLKVHTEEQLEKLHQHFDKIIEADVVLSVEKHRHIADVTLHANGLRIHGKEATEDMYSSLDAVVAKLDRQIRKHKSRIKKFKHRDLPAPEDYNHSVIDLHDQTDDAADGSENGSDGVERIGHRVVQHEKLSMKPLSIEEAIMQLDLTDDLFLMFVNDDTQKVNAVYKHSDGTFGLIEPPF